MKVLRVRNVNEALRAGVRLMTSGLYRKISPRGIPTLEYPESVATVYQRPCERVLFSAVRDANPFFHFFEALALLAGRDDVAFVQQFNSRMIEYSDDGVSRHGAYGKRLRLRRVGGSGRFVGCVDQVRVVVDLLKKEPDTRRAVLQIWDWEQDLGSESKDIPCNDLVFLLVRHGRLNMTVCCRSNDMIWGAYGSNAVEFSMLQEYIAAMVGVEVGTYVQISNSFHVYAEREDWVRIRDCYVMDDRYAASDWEVRPFQMVSSPASFDAELKRFMADPGGDLDEMQGRSPSFTYHNRFFPDVAMPLWKAWQAHKKTKDGWLFLVNCEAADWRVAAQEWLARRGDHG